ncbi:MAG: hypothetical protein SGARI_001843, partial [Bacillariaceae sp.]
MSVEGALRGETSDEEQRRAMSKDSDDSKDETADSVVIMDHCRDIPIRVRYDDSQTNFATLYTGIYAWGNTAFMDDKDLCDAFEASYKSLTDCSDITGSYREVGDCEVIDGAIGPDVNAKLLRLTYFANTVNGAQLYEFETPDPACYCDRCPGLDAFP